MGRVKGQTGRTLAEYLLRMKHVTNAEKSLLMGDDAADSLLEYARLLGEASHVDTVTVRALGPDEMGSTPLCYSTGAVRWS